MTHASDQPKESKASGILGLSILDRAWEIEWALRLACAATFADALLVGSGKGSLLHWPVNAENVLGNLGILLGAIAAFSICATVLAPLLATLVGTFLHRIYYSMPSFATDDPRPYQRPLGYAPARKFRDLALKEQSSFLLQIHQSHVAARQAEDRARESIGQLVFLLGCLAVADFSVSPADATGASLIGLFATSGKLGHALGAALIWIGLLVLKTWWFPPERSDLIYYPPLDTELRKAENTDVPLYRRNLPMDPSDPDSPATR